MSLQTAVSSQKLRFSNSNGSDLRGLDEWMLSIMLGTALALAYPVASAVVCCQLWYICSSCPLVVSVCASPAELELLVVTPSDLCPEGQGALWSPRLWGLPGSNLMQICKLVNNNNGHNVVWSFITAMSPCHRISPSLMTARRLFSMPIGHICRMPVATS